MPEDDLETRLLSGQGFSQPRSSSPTRSACTSSEPDTDDELGSDLSELSSPQHSDAVLAGIERKGPNTGVKGVIKDAQHRKAVEREIHRMKIAETNKYLESKSFQAQTIDEEDKDKRNATENESVYNEEARQRWLRRRQAGIESQQETDDEDIERQRRKTRMREVGEEGFLDAVEREGWVLVMLYEPDVPRCRPLLQAVLSLSQHISNTRQQAPSFIQARATSLSFSLLPNEPPVNTLEHGDDDEDEDEYEDEDYDESAQERRSRRSDPDVLPTLLAYRDGELVETFIRIDWEAGADGEGLERLLIRKGILKTGWKDRKSVV